MFKQKGYRCTLEIAMTMLQARANLSTKNFLNLKF